MSDVPGGSQSPGSYPILTPGAGPIQPNLSTSGAPDVQDAQEQYQDASAAVIQRSTHSPAQFQHQQQFAAPYQPRQNMPAQPQMNMGSSSTNMAQSQTSGRGPAFNMSSLGAALPDSQSYGQGFVQQTSQRYPSGPSQAAIAYQLQQNAQFVGQMALNQPNSSVYNMQYPQTYQGKYAHQQTPSMGQQSSPNSGQQYIPSQNFMSSPQPQQISPYYFQGSQYPPQGQLYASNQQQLYNAQYGTPGNLSGEAGLPSSQRKSEREGGQTGGATARQNTQSAVGQTSVLRGPPRKPKQSGYALWVGNLPPGTNVVDLKDHFSRDATNDILSVFLISKSNCAFVNYKTEESCAAAMTRFHDSRFQSVRLVCRLRRSSVSPVSGVPTGPSATSASPPAIVEPGSESENVSQDPNTNAETREASPGTSTAKDKFFIVKSLTIEDLDLSVRNGVWATQSHNEEALNKAYATAENVYLIFSANKSGEYFGYARMTSPINDDPSAAIEFAPKAQTVEDSDLPKAIPTPATDFAPKGRIIDDSARGTIFWEAEFDEAGGVRDTEDQRSDPSDQELDSESPTKAWGKPFSIEWLSTNRLPFYRTRGLRNPWNSNREVKIARDGTELETSIGRRLIQMFHREPSPTVPTMPMALPPSMGGYPPMRPY